MLVGALYFFVPLLLPIGSNNPNQYLAFGDSITRGEGDPGGGYPGRLQGKLSAHFGAANVRNRGADATNSYEALERLKRDVSAMKGTAAKVDVAAFKERYGISRKYAIPLLEWLDRERVTRRVGDARVIL